MAIFLHPTSFAVESGERRLAGWLAGWVGGIFSRFRSERKPDLQTVVDIESKRRLALCLFLCASCLDQFIMVNRYESGVRFRACHWRRRLSIILYSPFRNVVFATVALVLAKHHFSNMTPVSYSFALSCARKSVGKIDDLSELSNERMSKFLKCNDFFFFFFLRSRCASLDAPFLENL